MVYLVLFSESSQKCCRCEELILVWALVLPCRAVQQRNHLRSWQNVARPSLSTAVSNVLDDLKRFYGHISLQERAAIDHLHTALPQKPNNSWMLLSDSALLVYFFFFRGMTDRTSLTFPIPFVLLLPLVLVTLTSLTLLSSEDFHVPGFIQRENRAEAVWVKFALWMHVLVLKWDCSGDVQRVLLALNQTPPVAGIPALPWMEPCRREIL